MLISKLLEIYNKMATFDGNDIIVSQRTKITTKIFNIIIEDSKLLSLRYKFNLKNSLP